MKTALRTRNTVLSVQEYRCYEELYYGLRLLVLQKPVNWDTLFGEIFSPVIPVVLLSLVVFVYHPDSGSQESIS